MVVKVKFEYKAVEPDELTLHVGDIIQNCMIAEEGWMEGELNGKRGVFPGNFVVEITSSAPAPGVCVCVCLCVCVCTLVHEIHIIDIMKWFNCL